jgi:RHS repeat-associated protein
VSQTVTKGTVPSLSVLADPATNRIVGASYDANGNLLGGGYSYDVENRLVSAGAEQYAYDGNNRRVWKRRQVGEEEYRLEVFFYGLGGERLGTYEMVRNGATLTFTTVADNLYFGGRLIRSGREVVAVDRLGSVRWRRNLDTGAAAQFDYWPYGQEKPSATAQEREKFGTYYRDATGLDYADQRYYSSTSGRFLTADPFVSATALRSPTRGWNRYAYVEGDPVNKVDPQGLDPWWVESLMHSGEVGGGGWWGPWRVDVWGLPWWMPFPEPRPVQAAPPAPEVPPVEPSTTPAPPISNPFGITGVQAIPAIPCPVSDPHLCVAIKMTIYVIAATALLVEAIQQAIERSRGQSDPYTLPRVNPGRDSAGNCNPCPPGSPAWQSAGDAHGSTTGTHWHWIEYHQNPKTCECYPVRRSGPAAP